MLHPHPTLLKLKTHRHARLMFFIQLMAKTGEVIDPGFNTKHIAARLGHLEMPGPPVVAQTLHGRGPPCVVIGFAPVQPHGQLIVTIDKHGTADVDLLADGRLDRKLTALQHRGCALNSDARQ